MCCLSVQMYQLMGATLLQFEKVGDDWNSLSVDENTRIINYPTSNVARREHDSWNVGVGNLNCPKRIWVE